MANTRNMNTDHSLTEEIRAAGLRVTPPRLAVLRLLREQSRPLSHLEVVSKIENDAWNPATLYRNLIKLREVGLARVASQVGSITRYESSRPHEEPHIHPHFACKTCRQVSCVHDLVLSLPQDPAWHQSLQDADLQLVGECPHCRQKKVNSSHNIPDD